MNIAQNVFALMTERGLNKFQLAKEAGISSGLISEWESGKKAPGTKSLQKLSEYFGVPIAYFYGDNNSAPAPTKAESDDLKKVIIARSPEPLADEDAETLMKLLDSTVDSTIAAFLEARKNGRKTKRK